MTDESKLQVEDGFWVRARKVLIKWEKLRLFYNLLLLLMVTLLICENELLLRKFYLQLNPFLLVNMLGFAIGANILFFAAPAIESYASWLGFKSQWLTVLLFIGGVAISFPLVIECLQITMWHGLFHGM